MLSEYILKLTSQELQILGLALGELPFKQSAPLINKLQTQIQEQEKEDGK